MTSPNDTTYDLAVIGAGDAGLAAALEASRLGVSTVLIEKEKFGGYSLWSGAVPAQTLIKSARVFDTIKRSEEFGVHVEQTRLIWGAVKMRIADVRDDIRNLQRDAMKATNIEVVSGVASFETPNAVRVSTASGERKARANQFILATGAKPFIPTIDGLANSGFLTPGELYTLPMMPRSMTILGGGAVACELAQALARFGCKVTLLHEGDSLLSEADEEIATAAQRVLEQEGAAVQLNVRPIRVHRDDDDMRHVEYLDADGATHTVQAAHLLIAQGGEPNLGELNLTAAGVHTDASGVAVDEYLRTSVPHILACGAVAGRSLPPYLAEHQGQIAVRNVVSDSREMVDERCVPWTLFTDPEIAWAGLNEQEARARFGSCKTLRRKFNTLSRAIIEGESRGFIKVVTDESSRLLGVHIVGPSAAELIHPWLPAIREGEPVQEVTKTLFASPTLSAIAGRLEYEATDHR